MKMGKTVHMYSEGKDVATYESIAEASRKSGYAVSTIRELAKNKRETSEGFSFVIEEPEVQGKRIVSHPTVTVISEGVDGYAYKCVNGLLVIQSWEMHENRVWIHTSFSRRTRMPSYDDMAYVKSIFIGDDARAIMILPEKEKHVNIHPFCLHFFTGDDRLPDFTKGTRSL